MHLFRLGLVSLFLIVSTTGGQEQQERRKLLFNINSRSNILSKKPTGTTTTPTTPALESDPAPPVPSPSPAQDESYHTSAPKLRPVPTRESTGIDSSIHVTEVNEPEIVSEPEPGHEYVSLGSSSALSESHSNLTKNTPEIVNQPLPGKEYSYYKDNQGNLKANSSQVIEPSIYSIIKNAKSLNINNEPSIEDDQNENETKMNETTAEPFPTTFSPLSYDGYVLAINESISTTPVQTELSPINQEVQTSVSYVTNPINDTLDQIPAKEVTTESTTTTTTTTTMNPFLKELNTIILNENGSNYIYASLLPKLFSNLKIISDSSNEFPKIQIIHEENKEKTQAQIPISTSTQAIESKSQTENLPDIEIISTVNDNKMNYLNPIYKSGNKQKFSNPPENELYGKYFDEDDLHFGKGANHEDKILLPAESETRTRSKIETKEVNGTLYEYEYIYYYYDDPQYPEYDYDVVDITGNHLQPSQKEARKSADLRVSNSKSINDNLNNKIRPTIQDVKVEETKLPSQTRFPPRLTTTPLPLKLDETAKKNVGEHHTIPLVPQITGDRLINNDLGPLTTDLSSQDLTTDQEITTDVPITTTLISRNAVNLYALSAVVDADLMDATTIIPNNDIADTEYPLDFNDTTLLDDYYELLYPLDATADYEFKTEEPTTLPPTTTSTTTTTTTTTTPTPTTTTTVSTTTPRKPSRGSNRFRGSNRRRTRPRVQEPEAEEKIEETKQQLPTRQSSRNTINTRPVQTTKSQSEVRRPLRNRGSFNSRRNPHRTTVLPATTEKSTNETVESGNNGVTTSRSRISNHRRGIFNRFKSRTGGNRRHSVAPTLPTTTTTTTTTESTLLDTEPLINEEEIVIVNNKLDTEIESEFSTKAPETSTKAISPFNRFRNRNLNRRRFGNSRRNEVPRSNIEKTTENTVHKENNEAKSAERPVRPSTTRSKVPFRSRSKSRKTPPHRRGSTTKKQETTTESLLQSSVTTLPTIDEGESTDIPTEETSEPPRIKNTRGNLRLRNPSSRRLGLVSKFNQRRGHSIPARSNIQTQELQPSESQLIESDIEFQPAASDVEEEKVFLNSDNGDEETNDRADQGRKLGKKKTLRDILRSRGRKI